MHQTINVKCAVAALPRVIGRGGLRIDRHRCRGWSPTSRRRRKASANVVVFIDTERYIWLKFIKHHKDINPTWNSEKKANLDGEAG